MTLSFWTSCEWEIKKKKKNIQQSAFEFYDLFAIAVGNGSPLQYSCLRNSVDEDPGGLQSMEPQKTQTQLRD